MKILEIQKFGIIIVLCLVIASCAGRPVKFNELTEQKYDATKPKAVIANACGFQLLLVIPININSRARIAYDRLIKEAGINYVVKDINVQEIWYYALIGTVYCTEFQGTAYPKIASENS